MNNAQRLEIAKQWLMDSLHKSEEDAEEDADRVDIHAGPIRAYLEPIIQDRLEGKFPWVLAHFDWDSYANDLQREGDLVEISNDLYVTNANEL